MEEGRKKGGKGNIYQIPVPRYLATHTNFCFLICLIIIHQSKKSNVLKIKKTEACGNELTFLTPEPMFF